MICDVDENGLPLDPDKMAEVAGFHLARLADTSVELIVGAGESPRSRCDTCAFREGSDANRCGSTLITAIECIRLGEPFFCHEDMEDGKPTTACAGWANAIKEINLGMKDGEFTGLRNYAEVIKEPADVSM